MALRKIPNARVAPEESLPSWIGRQLGSAGLGTIQTGSTILQALENLGSLPGLAVAGLASKLTGRDLGLQHVLQSPVVKESLTKGGLSQEAENLAPQSFKEEPRNLKEFFLQRGLSQLPFAAAAAPQQLLQSALRTGVGAGAATLAKAADLGPLGQAATQILAEGAYGRATRPTLAQKATEAYRPISEIKPYGLVSTKPLEGPLRKIEYLWDKQTDTSKKDLLKGVYDAIRGQGQAGKSDLRDLWEIRTSLGKDWSKFKKAGFEPIMTELRQGINDAIKGNEAKMVNPKWWESLTEGDKLKTADNIKTSIDKFIELLPSKLIKKITGLAVLPDIVSRGEYLLRALGDPTARKHYFQLGIAAAEGSKTDFIKYANQLSKSFPVEKPKGKLKRVVNARVKLGPEE